MSESEKFDLAEFLGFGNNEDQSSADDNSRIEKNQERVENELLENEKGVDFDEQGMAFDRGQEFVQARLYEDIGDELKLNDIVSLSIDPDNSARKRLAKESSNSIYGSGVTIAVENDWLELSDDQAKSSVKPQKQEASSQNEDCELSDEKSQNDDLKQNNEVENDERKGKKLKDIKFISDILGKKSVLAASLAVIIIIAAVCAFTIGGVNATEWWSTVKREALGVFGIRAKDNKMVISAISTVDSVKDGEIIISGGSLAVVFTDGKVINVTDSTVTVEYSDDTQITYGMLKDIKVVSGQLLSCYDIIGYYDEAYTVNIFSSGKKVENIAVMGNSIVWEA